MLDEKFYIQLKIFLRGKELRKRKLPNVVVQRKHTLTYFLFEYFRLFV